MSKELVGNNGKVVGSMDYFNKLNDQFLIKDIVKSYSFNYYASLKAMSKKINKLLDEVYLDLKSNENYLSFIDRKYVNDTVAIINGLSSFCKKFGESSNKANECIKLISSSKKSIGNGWDIKKSTEYALSNKNFNKKDSIKILEDYVKNGKKTIKGDSKKTHFIESISRSSKSGFLNDVLLNVYYLEGKKKLIGKCGKVLCSKEYNNYIFNVATLGSKIVNCLDYDKLVMTYFQYIVDVFWADLNKGCKDNDYITYQSAENLIRFVKDLEKCGKNRYNFNEKINYLNWFVGGDTEKILKLQRKLNSAGLSTKVMEDGVYGYLTEKAWKEYIGEAIKIALLPVPLKQKYLFDNHNFVIGYGGYFSVHFMGAISVGVMVYIDDDYEVAIMFSKSDEITIDPAGVSAGIKGEISLDAENVNSMSGNSYVIDAGASTPIVEIGASGGFSRSFDGKTTSYSGGVSYGPGLIPVDANFGSSNNKLLIQFNAIKWLKSSLNIK